MVKRMIVGEKSLEIQLQVRTKEKVLIGKEGRKGLREKKGSKDDTKGAGLDKDYTLGLRKGML